MTDIRQDLPDYTTINVYKEDRDLARATKRPGETWSDFLRDAAEARKQDNQD